MKLLPLALVSSLFLGCGGDETDPITFQDLPNELAIATCAKSLDCCDSAELTEQDIPSDQGMCVTKLGPFVGILLQFQPAIDAGKIIYDADRAGSCIAEQSALSCNDFARTDSAICDGIFQGTIAKDMACEFNEECVSQNCSDNTSTCQNQPSLGEACPEFSCATGMYCGESGEQTICIAVKADGESCTYSEQCINVCNGITDSNALGTCGRVATCDGV